MKITLIAIALTVLPALAHATGCQWDHSETAASCAQGMTWDAAQQKCVTATTS